MAKEFITALLMGVVVLAGCSKSNKIAPVSGTIDGKPAISLYGSSGKPTDYMFIDTTAAGKKISYEGIVFTYNYGAPPNVYLINSGIPAAEGVLDLTGPHIVLTISAAYTLTFGSTVYTSK